MNKTQRILNGLIAILLLAAPGFSAITINAIRIENLEKAALDDSFVRAYTSLRAGRELVSDAELNEAVAQDVDNLRKSGRFSYVRAFIEQEGEQLTLVYSVAPRLRLRQIEVVGAEKIGNRKIKTELGLELGDYVDEALVGEKARKVETYCRKNKYPEATVTWDLKADQQTSAADLQVTVNEGSKLRVKRIRFEGERFMDNSHLARTGRFFKRLVPGLGRSGGAIDQFEVRELNNAISQKKTWWITSWFGVYHPELTDSDRTAIRDFYLNHGFLDVQVDEPEVQDLGGGGLELVYRIHEGDVYRLGTVDFDGATLFESSELEKQLHLSPDQVASRAAIDGAASSVNRFYGNRGYIRSYVQPVIQTDPLMHTADVRFNVYEGELAYINEITIRGNEKTRDEVLRRELAVYPGELFHQQKVETSENRLKNLNYFETVSRSYVPSAVTNAYDLSFKVKEKTMGSFMIGAGFSSVDSLVGFAEVSHGNFDIKRWPPVGDGQKMKVRVQLGAERNDLEISFVEPWFLDRKLALGVDLYSRTADYYSDDYTQTTLGSRVSLSKPLSPFTRGTLSYSLERFDVSGVSTNYTTDTNTTPATIYGTPTEISNEEGARTKSTVGVSISRDTRDQYFIPTRGNNSSVGVELSGGPFGGDTQIYFLEAKSSHFWPLWNGHVLSLRGEVRMVEGYGDGQNVPIFDKLFLGGPRTLRGFAYRDVSPRTTGPIASDEPIGGKSSYFGSLEYTVPLWNKIRGAIFYDIGAVNENAFNFSTVGLNSDYGFGVRFDLPMFPLRLDYAFPQITDEYNEGAQPRWNFLLGYAF